MSVQITIVGLNTTGASIGMALAKYKQKVTCIGIDREPETSLKAEKDGIIDKAAFNLERSVDKSDIVLLTIPAHEIKETLEAISGGLRPGVLVLDTSSSLIASTAWAKEILPANCYFTTFYPTLNPSLVLEGGINRPSADRYQGGQIIITAPNDAPVDVINLASDLARLLEAVPFFCDPYEFQGWHALTNELPQVVATAMLSTSAAQPGWEEASKIVGAGYISTVRPVDEASASAWILNQQNLLRVIDQYILSLQGLRSALQNKDETALSDQITHANQLSARLDQQVLKGGSYTTERHSIATPGESIARAFGIPQLMSLFKNKK